MSTAKILIPWVGLLTAIFLGFFALPEAVEGLTVAQHADSYRSTRAEVEQLTEREHKVGPDTAYLKFSYRVGKRKYYGTNHLTVWSDDEESIEEKIRREPDGTRTLLVWYDPDTPRRVVIEQQVSRTPHILWIVATFLIGLWSIWTLRGVRRRKRVIEEARQRRLQSRPSSSSSSGTGSTGSTSSDGDAS